MTEVRLIRLLQNEKQTLGILIAINSTRIFICKTLELAWKDNQPSVSCIPQGEYQCIYTRSRRLSSIAGKDVYTYELQNVPDRSGIRIHAANYFFQLKGCIALGSAMKDLNTDQQLDMVHSGETLQRFEEFMRKKEFKIKISYAV